MESPYNRPVAANLIGKIIDEVQHNRLVNPFICGFSEEMIIYSALKEAGYLTEEAMVRDEN